MKNSTFYCGMLIGIPPWGIIAGRLTENPWMAVGFTLFQLIGTGIIITKAIQTHREYKKLMAMIETLKQTDPCQTCLHHDCTCVGDKKTGTGCIAYIME